MATLSSILPVWNADLNSSLTSINNTVIAALNTTNSTHIDVVPTPNSILKHITKLVYLIGIIGNAAAIIILRKGERRVRNRKHLLLLTSLAANDFVALVGMLATCIVSEMIPTMNNSHIVCVTRVVLRVFGIGSVCIAVTMAMERYLALTRPFLYQKQVTYYVISTALLLSWSLSAILTCTPLAGFGVYYDFEGGKCLRYKQAKSASDFVYGWVYVAFGTILCVILVYCNLAVIQALYAISTPKSGTDPVVIRVSKSSCRQRSVKQNGVTYNAATAEEVAFSRLMATLSVLFIICWMPQIVTSSLYLGLGEKYWPKLAPLGGIADMLLLMNYVVDPILYVLMRRSRFSVDNICKSIAHCFKKKSHRSSEESIKTSCCPQETLLSDSGAELRPLRASNVPTAALVKIHD